MSFLNVLTVKRSSIAAAVGAAAGQAYNIYLHSSIPSCGSPRQTWVPILIGAAAGVFIVVSSKWD